MAQFFYRTFISILFFVSHLGLSNVAFAQLTVQQCATRAANNYEGLYRGIKGKATNDPMKWCPLWAAVCSHIHRNCRPSAVTCKFENYDSSITTLYDPGSSSTDMDFRFCTSCNVITNIDPRFLFDIAIPTTTRRPGATPTTGTDYSQTYPPGDFSAENSSASSATAAITALLIVGGIVGSVVAVKTSVTHSGFLAAGGGGGTTATVANPQTGSGNIKSTIDAVTLLLHFQSISTSGFLSLSYPPLYRFFSYNFAWANLIIASDAFKHAVRSIGADSSCLGILGSLNPAVNSDLTGMAVLGRRYDLDRATIGGLVYLTAIIGVAVALALFGLISVILHILNAIYKPGKFQSQVEIWPSRASSMTLRLFLWVLGSITTFATYQFVKPCSGKSLIAFASAEFALIILTLLIVSVWIIKTANALGPEALYTQFVSESEEEESIYARKWGSMYGLFKPAFYSFFVPDYVWVLVKGIIVGVGQDSGLAQVCLLIGVELVSFLALLSKRPYSTSSGNAFHIFSTCKRLVVSVFLVVFWDGFDVRTDIKRVIAIILMTVESTYAAALFVVLLLNGGARIVKWKAERKERRRASATTTRPLVPPMHYTDSDFSDTSPIQEKHD